MRLIDADALHLGKFVEPRTEWHQGWNDALNAATTQAPTIDAVPVVRCKDCKYFQDNNSGYPHDECRWGKGETLDPDDFCSYGERKAVRADAD